MKVFYILKPDMLFDSKAINYYKKGVLKNLFVSNSEFFKIKNWDEFSKLLYDQDVNLKMEELISQREKILTTILGYKNYFPFENAILNTFDIPDDDKCLKQLFDFKKKLRQKFVYNTNQYFVNIKDNNLPYENKIITYDLDNLDLEYKVLGPTEVMHDNRFKMIFFNKIHFPDPDYISLKNDFNLLEDYGVFKDVNRVYKIGGKRL